MTTAVSGGAVVFSGSVATPTTFIVDIPYTALPLLLRPSGLAAVTYTFTTNVNGAPAAGSTDTILVRPRP